jgi:hypothetical protein
MPAYTGHDRLARLLAPVMPDLMPPAEIDTFRRVRRALDGSGFVDADAVPPLGQVIVNAALDDTTYNSTSTSAWTTCVEVTQSLPPGTWSLVALAMSRGGHSAGTSIDYRITVNGDAYGEITRTAPTSSAAPFFSLATVAGIPGGTDVVVLAEFKCDAGSTATISDSVLTTIYLRTA